MMKFKPFLIIMLSALFSITATSCSDEETIEAFNDDFEYLELPESTDFNNLSDYEYSIIINAGKRVNFHVNENGLYESTANNAAEINISPKLFNYYMKILTNINNYILDETLHRRNSLLSRGEIEGYYLKYDCIAQAMAAGNYILYDEYSSILCGLYGIAPVPASGLTTALSLHGKPKQLKSVFLTNGEVLGDNFIVLYFPAGNKNMGHAVNGRSVKGGSIECYDYQQRRNTEVNISTELYDIYFY